jgi:hypothetical protein
MIALMARFSNISLKIKTMKLFTILALTVLVTVPALASPQKNLNNTSVVRVLATKMDIFYFSVPKTMMGAEIEVYNETGELIATQIVTRHKTIVDFYTANPGHYTIIIKKDGNQASFNYSKNAPSPLIPLEEISTELNDIKITLRKKTEKWYC